MMSSIVGKKLFATATPNICVSLCLITFLFSGVVSSAELINSKLLLVICLNFNF